MSASWSGKVPSAIVSALTVSMRLCFQDSALFQVRRRDDETQSFFSLAACAVCIDAMLSVRLKLRRALTGMLALVAVAISNLAALPAQAMLQAGAQIDVTSCAYPPGQVVNGNEMHQYFADTAAFYAGLYVPTNVPGGHFQIKGQYPKASWFDWTTNEAKIPLGTLGALDNVNIVPDPGSTNPYQPGVNYDPDHNYYTINVKDAPLAQRTKEANVLWGGWHADPVIPAALQKVEGQILLYYVEGATDDSRRGGVPIPSVSWVVDDPKTNPFQMKLQVCAAMRLAGRFTQFLWAINKPLDKYIWEKYEAQVLNKYNLPIPVLFDGPSLHPEASVIRPSPGGYWFPLFNEQSVYVAFSPSTLYGKFYTIRFKAPTHNSVAFGIPRTGLEQTQFWAWCTGSLYSLSSFVRSCLNDRDVHPDANGFVTIVVSPADQRPVINGQPYADWLEWTGSGGAVAWQIVDANNATWPQNPGLLPQSPWQHVPLLGDFLVGSDPNNVRAFKSLMGDYYPVVQYCNKARVEAGDTCQ